MSTENNNSKDNGNTTTKTSKMNTSSCESSSPCTSLQPTWHAPYPDKITHDVGLMVMNSLTREKEKFLTIDGGRSVKWYM
mmetsp:Transcript_5730/g.8304  ORF Transcript_5730/g.8304 Transcript_5730/m.8304 type:complete len:80 (-) Transcript_5730:61-300(-)